MSVKAKDLVEGVEVAYKEKWGYIWGTKGVLWTQAKQTAIEKKYASDPEANHNYKLAAEKGSKWIGHKVTDCSGLPCYVLEKLGVKIYHGSNSIWNKNLSHKGKITKGMNIPVGAAIFTEDEKGGKPHIGTLVTSTCVNEAKGTNDGVVHTPLSNKKWKYWGLYKGVTYDFIPGEEGSDVHIPAQVSGEPLEPEIVMDTHTTLRKSAKGEEVKLMQELLLKAGEKLPKYGADGDFGNETLKAVKHFQTTHGLKVDGIVGKLTWAELLKGR